jgi:CRISPR-associated protein Cpf1
MKEKFKNLYSVSKTLRFELIPEGKTQESFNTSDILITDEDRSESYKEVKKIMDRYHEWFINESLKDFKFNEGILNEYYRLSLKSRSEKENTAFNEIKKSLRSNIVKIAFKKNEIFEKLFKKDVIFLLEEFVKTGKFFDDLSDEEKRKHLDYINKFKKFSTYFTGFFENRKNVYSDEAKHSSIVYRSVDENLPLFLSNLKIFEDIKKKDSSLVDSFNINEFRLIRERSVEKFENVEIDSIDDMFTLTFFNRLLTQNGIDFFNSMLGGFADKQKEKSIEGLNQKLNQSKIEKIKFKPLKKQILCESSHLSKPIEKFESDDDMIQAIQYYYQETQGAIANLAQLWNELLNGDFDYSGIYLSNNQTLTTLSNRWLGHWDAIKECAIDYNTRGETLTVAKNKKENALFNKRQSIKLSDVQVWINNRYENKNLIDFLKMCDWQPPKKVSLQDTFNSFNQSYQEFETIIKNLNNNSLRTSDKAKEKIQSFLDLGITIYKALELFKGNGDELDRDLKFYSTLDTEMNILEDILYSVYNKSRNYLTKKPYSLEKFKLNFDTTTLLNGWAKSKEKDNLGVLLQKDDNYYLAILNTKYKKVFDQVTELKQGAVYKKMTYNLLPGPNKMFPKVFFSKGRQKEFEPSEHILRIYEKGSFKKGADFNLEDCHALIDFFKASIAKNSDWSSYKFKFSDTHTYADLSEFYKEVEQSGYNVQFTDYSAEYIDNLVNEGKLYLFQIYCKDFSPNSKGRPNLHTIYWRALFDPKNLEKPKIKLNGEAQVFYRKKSIFDSSITHPKRKAIKNKQKDADGTVKEKVFNYDLIKDKRFRMDKFQFHVNITLNHGVEQKTTKQINQLVRSELAKNKKINIIGIDRGENHLLYYSLIDQDGNILEQNSLNKIKPSGYIESKEINYHELLDNKEKERGTSRKNWGAIHNIKELKAGYLSQVIHKITQLMIEKNAIVVLENLNMGFKATRSKVEKQVYQKFEKMLIDKLSFMVGKTKSYDEDGGVYQAYQLSTKFVTFEKMGLQNGWLFYVDPSYTSTTDPTTGFAPVYKFKRSEKVEAIKEALKHITQFRLNIEEDYFEFDMNFAELKPNFPHKYNFRVDKSERHIFNVKSKRDKTLEKYIALNLKQELEELFNKYNIDYATGNDVSRSIQGIKQRAFFDQLTFILNTLFKLRYRDEQDDYILSPTPNAEGVCFDSREERKKSKPKFPIDGDANGAYHIALKGLQIIHKIELNVETPKIASKQEEWFKFLKEKVVTMT